MKLVAFAAGVELKFGDNGDRSLPSCELLELMLSNTATKFCIWPLRKSHGKGQLSPNFRQDGLGETTGLSCTHSRHGYHTIRLPVPMKIFIAPSSLRKSQVSGSSRIASEGIRKRNAEWPVGIAGLG